MQNQQNHFERFGLPVRFQVDQAALQQRYRSLQRQFHPDRFAGSSKQEQLLSVQVAANLNEGFETLRSPVARAHYLLELLGKPVDEDQQRDQLDPCFLMRQMELREDLAAIREASEPQQAIDTLRKEVRRELGDLEGVIANQFDEGTGQALDKAARLSLEMQFLAKLDREIGELEAQLMD